MSCPADVEHPMTADKRKRTRPGARHRETAPPSAPSNITSEPAQGTIDTQAKYRDRPTDDGKYGDADAQPRQGELRGK